MSEDRARPNPYTGLNGRGFKEGVYIQPAVKDLVTENVRRAIAAPWLLTFLDFWYDAGDGSNPMIRMVVLNQVTDEERTHDINVPDNGYEPWAGLVGPTLVAWAEATYGG